MQRLAILRLLVLMMLLAPGALVRGADPVSLGMWSWRQDAFSTATSRAELIEFCRSEGITHVDQHISIRTIDNKLVLQNAEPFRKLIVEAATQGITISALRGSPTMFMEDNWERTLAELAVLIDFQQEISNDRSGSTPHGALWGIKFDVEPYLTKPWKAGGSSRAKVIDDYLSCLTKVRQAIDRVGVNLKLGVDVPFWWDGSEHTAKYGDKTQAFVYQIQDIVDEIGIMSYRRSPEQVYRLSEDELRYSREQQKPRSVSPGLNLNPATGSEAITSFAGFPDSVFQKSLDALREKLTSDVSVRCVMLHSYRSLADFRRESGKERPVN